MCQIFSVAEGSGLQAGQFSTWTLLLRNPAVLMNAVCGLALSCWNMQHLPWKTCPDVSMCSKTSIYFSTLSMPFQMYKRVMPWALMQPLHQRFRFLNCALIAWRMVCLLFSPQNMVSVISKKINLTTEQFSTFLLSNIMSFGPEKTAAFVDCVHLWLLLLAKLL